MEEPLTHLSHLEWTLDGLKCEHKRPSWASCTFTCPWGRQWWHSEHISLILSSKEITLLICSLLGLCPESGRKRGKPMESNGKRTSSDPIMCTQILRYTIPAASAPRTFMYSFSLKISCSSSCSTRTLSSCPLQFFRDTKVWTELFVNGTPIKLQ